MREEVALASPFQFIISTTTQQSSGVFLFQVNTMDGWGITNTLDGYVIEAGNTIAVKAKDNIADSSQAIYWVAPQEYLGKKVSSRVGPS